MIKKRVVLFTSETISSFRNTQFFFRYLFLIINIERSKKIFCTLYKYWSNILHTSTSLPTQYVASIFSQFPIRVLIEATIGFKCSSVVARTSSPRGRQKYIFKSHTRSPKSRFSLHYRCRSFFKIFLVSTGFFRARGHFEHGFRNAADLLYEHSCGTKPNNAPRIVNPSL